MRRVISGYPAAGSDSRSSWDDEGDDELILPRRPPDWRLLAIMGVYGAVLFSVTLLLAV